MAQRRSVVCALTAGLVSGGTWAQGEAAAADATDGQRLRDAMDDMSRPHEVVPLGVGPSIGWKYRPGVAMGTEPYGSAIPSYWRGKRFAEWRAMLPWFVIYEGEPSNPARNVLVEINGIECWALSASQRRWLLVGAAPRPVWDSLYAPNAVDRVALSAAGREAEDGGGTRYATSARHMVHGGLGQLPVPWGDGRADMLAIVSSVRHRLVLERTDGPDERAIANIGVQAGVDYYPWKGAGLADLSANYVPGAGVGRFLKVTPAWRASTFFVAREGVSRDELLSATPPRLKY